MSTSPGKPEERAVIVYGVVEAAAVQQITAGKHEIPDGAVGKIERPSRIEFPAYGVDALTHLRPTRMGYAFEGLKREVARTRVR